MKEALRKLLENVWTLPNVLTMLRLLMVPLFAFLYLNGHVYWALAVFILASLTDLLDGYLARRNNLITAFGKLMDPLADKLMLLTVLLCFVLRGVFSLPALLIVLCKELVMVYGGVFLLRHGVVVQSALIGKTATCAFIAAVILGFFHDDFIARGLPQFDLIVLWLAVAITLCAFLYYLRSALRTWKKIKNS